MPREEKICECRQWPDGTVQYGGEFHGSMDDAVKTYHKMLDDLSKVDNNPINLQSNEN